jgi:hypothetical protein
MKQLIILTGIAFILAAGCKNPPPAKSPEGQAQPASPQPVPPPPDDEEGALDANDTETLARAVFEALRTGNVELYLEQTVHLKQDYKEVLKNQSAWSTGQGTGTDRNGPPFPSDKEIAKMCQQHRDGFKDFLALLQEKGLDPSQAEIKEIKTDKAAVKDGFGFAEDLTLVLQRGDLIIPVTIDDVMLTSRGWLIIDGLKLRE